MTDTYKCPQCGEDKNGAEVHTITHHTLMGLNAKQAKRFLDYPCEKYSKELCL